jgi:glycosyltransferase involved in cell wall biosynthesis
MISVIIPVYNQAQKLLKTLISLEKQTYRDLEIIIVNDGSSDGLENLCADYFKKIEVNSEQKISYLFLNQENKGAPAARNRGYKAAQGEYLFFCDADAVLETNALEMLLQALLNNPEASYAYSSFKWGRKLFKLSMFQAEKLQQGPCIHTMSLIRASAYPLSGFDESLKKFQDWDLWLTMLKEGKVGIFVDQVLFKVSPGGTISLRVPSFVYKLIPFLPIVKKYKKAFKIIKEKHGF